MIQLTLAKQSDIETIIQLAYVIWNAHYVPIIGQKQVDYMLSNRYHREQLIRQMNQDKQQFYLIHDSNQEIGFISVTPINTTNYFLDKFYILPQQANKGAGTQCLKMIIELIKPQILKLRVNRLNYKSINFYFKNGFVIESVDNLDIGNGFVMEDYVMIKRV